MNQHIENVPSFQPPQFANLRQNIHITFRRLPHWHQTGKALFTTFRMADSFPAAAAEEYYEFKRRWETAYPLPWEDTVKERFLTEAGNWMEQWCNKGYGSCLLANKSTRDIVTEAISHEDGTHIVVYAYVIMPNHVHILYAVLTDSPVTNRNIQNIKRYSARMINKHIGHTGSFWQKESFDRLVRNQDAFNRYLNYIINNPHGLSPDKYILYINPHLQ